MNANVPAAPPTVAPAKPAKAAKPAKSGKRKKLIRGICIALAVVLVVAVAARRLRLASSANEGITLTAVTPSLGDVTVSLTGSGSVAAIDQQDVVATVRGEILSGGLTVGQEVKKGDTLFTVDDAEARSSIEKAEISLKKAQLSYEQTLDSAGQASLTAPHAGTVTALYVKNGDTVGQGTRICDIVDAQTLKLLLPFHAADADRIQKGMAADVYLEATGETVRGTVSRVTSGQVVSASGVLVRTVEITLQNPGALAPGLSATAVVGSVACQDAGQIEYANQTTVYAPASGEIRGLTIAEGDSVRAAQLLYSTDNSSASVNLASAELTVRDAEITLNDLIDSLADYEIKAPISGVVIAESYAKGDTLDMQSTVVTTIADLSKLTFTMNIDELDIASVSEGMLVEITADAIAGVTFEGVVESIGIIGVSQNGVTTYPVKVVIDQPGALRPGMNVSARVIVERVENVWRVPAAAVIRGGYVIVKSGAAGAADQSSQPAGSMPQGSMPQGSMPQGSRPQGATGGALSGAGDNIDGLAAALGLPAGYTLKKVETGLANESYVEIVSGLAEGDEVYIIMTATQNSSQGGLFGGMGRTGASGSRDVVVVEAGPQGSFQAAPR